MLHMHYAVRVLATTMITLPQYNNINNTNRRRSQYDEDSPAHAQLTASCRACSTVESHLLSQRSRTFDIDRGFGITSKLAVITGAAAQVAASLQRIAAAAATAAAASAGAGGISSSSGQPLPLLALQSKTANRAAAAAVAAKEAAAEQTKQDFAKWCRCVTAAATVNVNYDC
jgi:hypothetical protein